MGIGYSTEYTSESESEAPRKPSCTAAKVLKLFSSAKRDEYLDSTDSEITLEDRRKVDYKSRRRPVALVEKLDEKRISSSPDRRRDSERPRKTVARDSLAGRRRHTKPGDTKQINRYSEQKHTKRTSNQLPTNNIEKINKSKPRHNQDPNIPLNKPKHNQDLNIPLNKEDQNLKVPPPIPIKKVEIVSKTTLVIPKASITESINKIVTKFSELGVVNPAHNKVQSTAPTDQKKENLQSPEVMNSYQRYSREPAEKDLNKGFEKNMKSCCGNCNCSGKHNHQPNKPGRVSDPYVINKCANNQKKPKPCQPPSVQPCYIPPPPPPNKFCDNKTCSNKNKPAMYNYGINKLHYPYEEPTGTSSSSYTQNTNSNNNCCNNCQCYVPCQQHRSCKCQCACDSSQEYYHKKPSEDQISCCSSTKSDFMNLAYQSTGEYPELVGELEDTLSQRNRMRVKTTMHQFEMFSRQNRNLEKPIFDDYSVHNLKQNCGHCRDDCRCCSKTENNNASKASSTSKSRSAAESRRSSRPRKPGYVEKVARYMDPNPNNSPRKYCISPARNCQKNGMDGSNGSWQMDSKKGEWVKVEGNNQYDFDTNYPPLPPKPRTDSGNCEAKQRKQQDYVKRHGSVERPCNCNKCRRNR